MDHVLIADDDEDIRTVTRIILEDAGYPCAEAADGNTLLRMVKSAATPMVVLFDVGLPYLDTAALLKLLIHARARMPQHVYVLFSARSPKMYASLLPFIEQLMPTTLRKPYAIDDLLDSVAQAARHLPVATSVPMVLHKR